MEEERENSDMQNNKIKLKIIDQDGAILEFKVKKGITFRKILKTFADQVNKDPSELRLVYNGKVLDLESTPDFYNMEDNDEVEVVASQVGGSN